MGTGEELQTPYLMRCKHIFRDPSVLSGICQFEITKHNCKIEQTKQSLQKEHARWNLDPNQNEKIVEHYSAAPQELVFSCCTLCSLSTEARADV